MSDFELVYMFTEDVNSLETAFMNFIAMLTAFLVAGYLVADKLKPSMVFIIVTLFTLAVLQQVLNLFAFQGDLTRITQEMLSRVAEGQSGISWHGSTRHPSIIKRFMAFNPMAVTVFGYFGALIFFFHQRHVGRAQ